MNKRKLSLIFAVSLTALSQVHGGMLKSIYGISKMSLRNAKDTLESGVAAYPVVGAGVTSVVSGAEYLLNSEEKPEAVSIEQSIPELSGQAKSLLSTYANKQAFMNGLSAIGTNAKNTLSGLNKESIFAGFENNKQDIKIAGGCIAAAVTTAVMLKKLYDYKCLDALQPLEEKLEALKSSPVVVPTKVAPVVAPVVTPAKVAPVVAPVVAPAKIKSVDSILKENVNSPSGIVTALKANGYTRADISIEILKKSTKLNDGQKKLVFLKLN